MLSAVLHDQNTHAHIAIPWVAIGIDLASALRNYGVRMPDYRSDKNSEFLNAQIFTE